MRVSVDLLLVGLTANWTLDSVLIGDTQLNWVAAPVAQLHIREVGATSAVRQEWFAPHLPCLLIEAELTAAGSSATAISLSTHRRHHPTIDTGSSSSQQEKVIPITTTENLRPIRSRGIYHVEL